MIAGCTLLAGHYGSTSPSAALDGAPTPGPDPPTQAPPPNSPAMRLHRADEPLVYSANDEPLVYSANDGLGSSPGSQVTLSRTPPARPSTGPGLRTGGGRPAHPFELVGPRSAGRFPEHIARRRVGFVTERLNSHNPWLANADFSFPVAAEGTALVLLDEAGAGCISYLWLSNPFYGDVLTMELDGAAALRLNFSGFWRGTPMPTAFRPHFGTFELFNGAWAATLPLCYRRRARVVLDVAWQGVRGLSVPGLRRCVEKGATCKVVRYHELALTRLFPAPDGDAEHAPNPFEDTAAVLQERPLLQDLIRQAKYPGLPAPEVARLPALARAVVAPGEPATIADLRGAGVVQDLVVSLPPALKCPRVMTSNLSKVEGFPLCLWIRITCDDAPAPQVDLPVAFLFGLFAEIHARRTACCNVFYNKEERLWLGVFRLPMPYWSRLRVELHLQGDHQGGPVPVWHRVRVGPNPHAPGEAGHLHAQWHFVGQWAEEDAAHWGRFVHHPRGWGHIVGLQLGYYGNPTWDSMLPESNFYLWRDGMRSPFYCGTGLEDFFGYAHGWNRANQQEYSFLGHVQARKYRRHTYRWLMADPFVFHDGVAGYLEANVDPRSRADLVTYFYAGNESRLAPVAAWDAAALCALGGAARPNLTTVTAEFLRPTTISRPFLSAPKTSKIPKATRRPPAPEAAQQQQCCVLPRNATLPLSLAPALPAGCSGALVLTRTRDTGYAEQRAEVSAQGLRIGTWHDPGYSQYFRLADSQLHLRMPARAQRGGSGGPTLVLHVVSEAWAVCGLDIKCTS